MGFKVRIEPSGHEFATEPGESILSAALRHGFMLPYSCRGGVCGSCKGRLLSGRVDYGGHAPPALSETEKAQGYALFCQAVPRADVVIQAREIDAARDIPVRTLPCRVEKMQRLAPDVMLLHLKLPHTERLQFLAGQYIEILLADGRRRSFSLANAPHDDACLQLHIRQVPGGFFTTHVFTQMREKDLLRIHGPLGTFFLRPDSDRPAILVAGGTGFAPIKGMLENVFAEGAARPLHFYWGVRTRRDLYLHDLVSAWTGRHPNFRYTPVLSAPLPEDRWDGRTGWVHAAVVADYPDLGGHEVYASGPPPMIEAAKQAFKAHGLPDGRLYYDSFEFAVDPAVTLR